MKTNHYFILTHKRREYKIDVERLCQVFSCLSGKSLSGLTNGEIMRYLKKYKLLDSLFLDSVNDI